MGFESGDLKDGTPEKQQNRSVTVADQNETKGSWMSEFSSTERRADGAKKANRQTDSAKKNQ